ncbi:hypothetical protein SB766_09800 [Pseudomonas sp. SIMBA_077]
MSTSLEVSTRIIGGLGERKTSSNDLLLPASAVAVLTGAAGLNARF